MKKTSSLIVLLYLLITIKMTAQITLSQNIGNELTKINPSRCDGNEFWARTFTLSDFGILTTDQFIIRSGQIAISNSYKGAQIYFTIFSIDDNFPNSEIKQLGYGGYVKAPEIGNIPEIVKIQFNSPIVIPSNIKKIMVVATQLDDIYNPNYKKVLIAGTDKDKDKSWFKGCGNHIYNSTDKLTNPITTNANYFLNVTGEKLSTINSNSNLNLSHNIGDYPIQTSMFSCTSSYQYWARKFKLKDFGVSQNEEFIIKKGFIGLSGAEWLSTVQFNIYKIDDNFPSSFSESDLIGSSQIEEVPYFGYSYLGDRAKIFLVDFKTPITIPSDVKTILIEVHKGISYGDGEAFIAGTEKDNDNSWYRGCNGDVSGKYKTTKDLWGNIPEWDNINFYITVNGEVKTILPFEVINDYSNCYKTISNFNLSNNNEIKSVTWDFDDPLSINNSSKSIKTSHQFSSPGVYNVKAIVCHKNGKTYTISKKIQVYETPIISSSVSLKQCDNIDFDGFTYFNLNEAKAKIISNQENYTITFHKEKIHAESNINKISNPSSYTNQKASNDIVWARVENSYGCFQVSEINLIISTTQIPSSFSKIFYKCDDGLNTKDGIATFDFSSVTQNVMNLFPSNQELIIKYYKNENDALSKSNEIKNINNYQNTESPNSQNIYIRIDNKLNNNCMGIGHHITLNVEKKPIANPISLNPECDNDKDGVFNFDTSTIHKTIIGNQTNVTVQYFDKDNNPLPSPLPNPFSTPTQKVTARVLNITSKVPNGQCYDETLINFVVNTTPTLSRVPAQKKCDSDFDGIESFDTSTIENTLLGNQTGMVVKYFDENNNPLPSPLPNPFTSSTQTIRVRVENPKYSLCFNETTIDFVVNEKPYFELDTQTIICTNISSSIDITVLNPKGNYYYTWKDENGNIISNNIKAKASKGGNYFVTAISNFGCESDTKIIKVIESSVSSITINDIEITDDSENNSIKINTSNIGFGNYEFSLLDSNSNTIYDYQKIPFFDNLKGGIYTILIKDINKCGVQSFVISIISYPKFFTPNQDGVNDTWHILGIGKSFYKKGDVKIYNRFGKLLKTLFIDSSGWDGTSEGVKLPSNDYWFYAELTDPKGTVITKKGSFSLIRK
ncbi:T9SS type B sorting domain-containing protein [Tenacibaculum aiptasiae]|uniref:T9SS type B sorting domain-containing protein n=1 Tax=Tenacibaculum aiptasiae TaxID=426481 RepID=A0A7J5A713_9FLAO|nr:T9SS type B sorting domain-containing protein [Tenacibaculum aiptasiae]KAB1153350.1 T9SS type B sorting domain-containing protein [Tenacibaculum aiptasiae]